MNVLEWGVERVKEYLNDKNGRTSEESEVATEPQQVEPEVDLDWALNELDVRIKEQIDLGQEACDRACEKLKDMGDENNIYVSKIEFNCRSLKQAIDYNVEHYFKHELQQNGYFERRNIRQLEKMVKYTKDQVDVFIAACDGVVKNIEDGIDPECEQNREALRDTRIVSREMTQEAYERLNERERGRFLENSGRWL